MFSFNTKLSLFFLKAMDLLLKDSMIILILHLPLGWHTTNSNSPSLSFFCQIISPQCKTYTRFSYWIVADVGCINFGVLGLQGSC
jgi:hypothetical protein